MVSSITRRLQRVLGENYFVEESPLQRAERVSIIKKGRFFRHPPQEQLDPLMKELFPDVSYNWKVFPEGFFDNCGTPEKDELVVTFNYPSNYVGHFIVFGNDNHIMLSLLWRGRYPTRTQENRYTNLITRVHSQFYQDPQAKN